MFGYVAFGNKYFYGNGVCVKRRRPQIKPLFIDGGDKELSKPGDFQ